MGLADVRAGLVPDEGKPFVCAQVVIAIDGSESTRDSGFQRQIQALDHALRHAELHQALQDCLPGSVALGLITWSGPNQQSICLPWSVVRNGGDLALTAFALQSCRYIGGTTDIGAAVIYALRMLSSAPYESYYRSVLLLTNGRTDRGAEARLMAARQAADRAKITLVGHALLRKSRSWLGQGRPDHEPLRDYVARNITAGPRAFWSASDLPADWREILNTLVRMLRQELN
ncbi:MAG TPA: DUF1194 domain-containing protein [Geminicoccaceae bacterium]